MDPRLQKLSYSSLLTLHSCPRKFQLTKLNSQEQDLDGNIVTSSNVTFAFGHVVGSGIQDVLSGFDISRVIVNMFCGWHADLMDSNDKQCKSFSLAVFAVQRFIAMRNAGLLEGYELVSYEGKPAIELSFCITLPNGFLYRGFVDAVLRHKTTGKILVLELKTSSSPTVNSATYKNSAQAIGYSIVLDVLFPEISSYDVLYLVYLTKQMEFESMMFTKSYLQRALWIRELILDTDIIQLYENAGVYPMRGENCFSWYRECEYYGLCTLDTAHLTKRLNEIPEEKQQTFQINLSLQDLISSQLTKISIYD